MPKLISYIVEILEPFNLEFSLNICEAIFFSVLPLRSLFTNCRLIFPVRTPFWFSFVCNYGYCKLLTLWQNIKF